MPIHFPGGEFNGTLQLSGFDETRGRNTEWRQDSGDETGIDFKSDAPDEDRDGLAFAVTLDDRGDPDLGHGR